jgi:protein TonB
MPLNVRRFGAVWLSLLIFSAGITAQTTTPVSTPTTTGAPTSGDVMRDRITKAKALVAVKNYNAAIYELEGIRKESNEPAVNSVVTVMLMNCYLEQSDYKRAQALLTDVFNAKKTNRFGGANYYAVAGQVVRGAKVQLDRYKSLGLMVSDANLPSDAAADINKMRETVETVITQSKTLSANTKETPNAMALLEEATGARGGLARDDFDAKRWKEEVADARDGLVNAKGVVDASGELASMETVASADTTAPLTAPTQTAPAIVPIADKTETAQPQTQTKPNNVPSGPSAQTETPKVEAPKSNIQPQTTAANQPKPSGRVRKVENQTAGNTATTESTVKSDAPMAIGSLVEYATSKQSPSYPATAKATRQTGTVRVELLIDEQGKPEVKDASGPGMLKQAATDAVKRWKFKPFTRDGQPVKATGYVSFNFNL